MLFQQDGATCHTAREIIQLLLEIVPSHVLSRFGDQNFYLKFSMSISQQPQQSTKFSHVYTKNFMEK